MKVRDGVYFCPWCSRDFKKTVGRVEGAGRKGVGVAQCTCPRCKRAVSQKTRTEMNAKMERGFKI